MDLSRRQWVLASLGIASATEIASAQQHAHQAATSNPKPGFAYLDISTAADIDAIASQILPSDGTPGAREAGVIYFIDRALTTFDKDKQPAYRSGLAAIQATRKEMFPQSRSVAGLTSDQQIALLHAIEKSEFFELLRMHTLMGFLGAPSYGGNRDQVGWKLIGFEDKMAFAPPFGYYDRVKDGDGPL